MNSLLRYGFHNYALLRVFTYCVPEGAQGHVRPVWWLDLSSCHVVLAEPLVDIKFSWHYSAGVFTCGYCMGLHHRLGRQPARVPGLDRLTFSSSRQPPLHWRAGMAAYNGRWVATGGLGQLVSLLPAASGPRGRRGRRLGEERRRRLVVGVVPSPGRGRARWSHAGRAGSGRPDFAWPESWSKWTRGSPNVAQN